MRNEAASVPTDGEAGLRRGPYSIRTWRSRRPQRASCCTGRSSGSSSLAGGTSKCTDSDRKRLQPRRDETALPAVREAPVAPFRRLRGRLPPQGGKVRGPVAKHCSRTSRCSGRTGPAHSGSTLEDVGFPRPFADCAVRLLELITHGPNPAFFAETGGGATRLSWGVGPSGGVGRRTLSHTPFSDGSVSVAHPC